MSLRISARPTSQQCDQEYNPETGPIARWRYFDGLRDLNLCDRHLGELLRKRAVPKIELVDLDELTNTRS